MSYQAIVCKIQTRPHPQADRLKLGTANGFQVVVGLDTEDGELGAFFPTDGRLSEDMCSHNDLIRRVDENGNRTGGMFDENRRVRSQKFRGERSDGYWTPLSSLAWTGADLSKLREGDQFSELNGKLVCEKYYTPATLKAMKGGTPKTRKVNRYFAEHVDTQQLRYKVDQIPEDSVIYMTLKMHGTSHRVGHVLDEVELPRSLWNRFLKRDPKITSEYRVLHGTRRVVLRDASTRNGFYGDDEGFRMAATADLEANLHKGEIIYGEIVGWTQGGAPIMSPQSTKEMKELRKQYGDQMIYKYGQPEGTCQFYIYRITRVNEEGVVTELPWPQVRARAHELGYPHVPDIAGPFVFRGADAAPKLLELAEALSEGADPIDPSHIREGVVVRVEKPNGETDYLKFKSFDFGRLEGYLKSDPNEVDREEIS